MLTVSAGAALTLVAERTAARKARENCMVMVVVWFLEDVSWGLSERLDGCVYFTGEVKVKEYVRVD